jgi:Na+-translocating ferredoxin:NAD+ oxidoreductase RnfE subunit
MGGKYSLALIIISLVREILGSGSISIIDKLSQILGFKLIINLPKFSVFPNPFFVSSAGAFLTLGLILALLYKGDDKNELN